MNSINIKSITSPNIISLPRFTPKLKLAVLASGKGSNLKAIIEDILSKRLDAEIKCLIVSNPNCGAIEIANKHLIPVKVVTSNDFINRESLDQHLVNLLHAYNVELVIMAGWMRIVTHILIDSFKNKIINIHPSLLPSFKGKEAVKNALNNKVKITGCTVHIVEEEVDSGEILIQSAVQVNTGDTEELLLKRIQSQEHKIISLGIAIAGQRLR
ncbi:MULTISPECIES: phosphoribosylglycinamide formyltransferase [Prochlorococcus]|uniref:Phosphoribosylglycinamide formyltransferase n=1 Tax=Prochlorococcus marinus (strain SARG / CCMP1375 / SS120) TaxID=167539 RepID=Q7VBZ7_PROMA|nr:MULTISPECIES: phosphoribosylglycinamide formyltransferase [Prochlorococcus]AAP99989.1 Folate-dependent phosphoribosylglycinamide formyltransferase PurN [Prochlorococcus marinus subsp. marinus str. CCMP1375]KGG13787.1 Phosphoribosylglycinamide formyltransferase [Prochlorococcus marinus str. LG]KGG18922.1 Phosphoribosylglycinamide formyltransferase [Prochlorococcus marinus str. SS2]KGG23540.1 Phosphoribosylglycinamide formyltransferase [Prochlorococcus marinus str. SS35]KGG32224.1 Phosphoribo